MEMIFDYLVKNQGEITKENFNIVDSLIITRIVYLPFNLILRKNESRKLKELLKILSCYKDKYFLLKDDIKLVQYLLKNKRFRNLEISNYVNILDRVSEKQFGALTIDLGFTTYVSFEGTDKTLVGWKEDFNMSFKKIPAQDEAYKYLVDILDKTSGDVIVGGHSKGGNLAIYSCIYLSDNKRIKKIYNFDGPGFLSEVLDEKGYDDIKDRIITIIPQSSIIGVLLNRKEKVNVINSSSFFVMQHDPYSWEIKGNDFVYLDKLTNISKSLDKSISTFLEQTTPTQRMDFIDNVYKIITSENSSGYIQGIRQVDGKIITKFINNVLKNIKL